MTLAFRSPSPHLKIEFQGGEPLLNFPLIRWIMAEAKRMNAGHGKHLAFVIATNLALLDDEILEFCAEQDDAPLHLARRPAGPAQRQPPSARPGQLAAGGGGHQAGSGTAWPQTGSAR